MPGSLIARAHPLADPAEQLRRLATARPAPFPDAPRADRVEVLQLNLGRLCNQTCRHCHVDAGPDRVEVMARETMEQALAFADEAGVPTVDLTGGAPELNPHFRWLVGELGRRVRRVIDRCNLTILETAPFRDLPEFLAGHRVEVVASLPHFAARTADAQRGDGVFDASIAALRRLNALGYGRTGSGLVLNLVYNPAGAFLPPRQSSIEPEYRRALERDHGVIFNDLYVLANLPIGRFLEFLDRAGQLEAYLARLAAAYNPATVDGLMCRTTLSVAWDGTLHDCDFNQMLALPLASGRPRHIAEATAERLAGRPVVTAAHCLGCTAGQGTTCGGAIVDRP
jgi:radical SAM/Cys-rich protein